jgi:protein-tyrosine-phosphatase
MLPRSHFPSPPHAIAAANTRNVDLSTHTSHHFGAEDAASAGIVVVFDSKNFYWLGQRFPKLRERTIFLDSFASRQHRTEHIADPDGGDLATFDTVYDRIDDSVAGLLSALIGSQKP